MELSGSEQLILNGVPDDYFILNVQDEMKFTDQRGMSTSGGIQGSHVIVNMLPGSDELKLAGNAAAFTGIFLAVQNTNTVKQSGKAAVIGTIVATLCLFLGMQLQRAEHSRH